MGWVYCSYCGERGHNRLGCPKRKKDAAANPEGYTAKQLAREAEIRKKAVASRTCSYCDQPGHNRRGCKVLKEDKKLILQRQKNYFEEFLDACDTIGLGPGSLIRIPHGPSEDPFSKQVLALVSAFNWTAIDFLNSDVDTDKAWGIRNRRILRARVVSTEGWEEKPGDWRGPPHQNSEITVTQAELCSLLPKVLATPLQHASERILQLVGPAHGSFKVPEVILSNDLNEHFNLDPGKRAKEWERHRKPLAHKEWQWIYPDEHEKAWSEEFKSSLNP